MSLNEKTMSQNNMLNMSATAEKVEVSTETTNRIAMTLAIAIPLVVSAVGIFTIVPQLF